jgi:hypothetical protein
MRLLLRANLIGMKKMFCPGHRAHELRWATHRPAGSIHGPGPLYDIHSAVAGSDAAGRNSSDHHAQTARNLRRTLQNAELGAG